MDVKMEVDKEKVFQAIVLMDTFNKNFRPITSPMAFLSVAGIPLIEYALQSLSDGRITKTILFCCKDPLQIEDYVRESTGTWKSKMAVEVKSSDTCQSVGDVMREINAASLVKGDFILMGINTISNIDFASLLEQHRQTVKKDKGAAMTLVFNELNQDHALVKSERSFFLAGNKTTKKILVHKKWEKDSKEKIFALPINHLLHYSELNLYHSLADPNIAVCSPSVPPLFADNLDFQTLESFIHGLLIQEDTSDNSLYYTLVKPNQYAAAVTNWKNYQVVSVDILHNSKYPRVIASGAYKEIKYSGKQGNKAKISRSCRLGEDVLIGADAVLGDNTFVSKAFIGNNVIIGDNVTIENSIIMDKAVIKNRNIIVNSLIGQESSVEEYCVIEGTMVAQELKVQTGINISDSILEKFDLDDEDIESVASDEDEFIGLAEMFNTSPEDCADRESCNSPLSVLSDNENDSVANGECEFIGLHDLFNTSPVECTDRPSCKTPPSVLSVFLNELIDLLARGFANKIRCDHLILEINFSRYAYNIKSHEINYFVVRALMNLPVFSEAGNNIQIKLSEVVKFFLPVFAKYINNKSSIMDCLKAVEETCIQCEWMQETCGHILLMMYDIDIVDKDSLWEFHEYLTAQDSQMLQFFNVDRFFDWLQDSDEESD